MWPDLEVTIVVSINFPNSASGVLGEIGGRKENAAYLNPRRFTVNRANLRCRLECSNKVDGLAGPTPQISRIHSLVIKDDLAQQGRDDRELRRVKDDRASQCLKVLKNRVHLGRVESKGNVKAETLVALLLKDGGNGLHLRDQAA